ncbi:MAG: class I SAM-dependent methyltransferase [Actinomycetota bacterium]
MGTDWNGARYAGEAEHHRALDDWFLDRLPPEPGDTIVDLGCGSGEFTARVAESVPTGRVIGVEPDPSMLQAARRHSRPGLEFLQASAETFDDLFAEGSIDKVLSRAMLHWIPMDDYPRVFQAVFRVLRPGGWFHSESAGAGNVPRLIEVVNDLADRFGTPPPLPFPNAGAVFDLVEEAGFEMADEAVRTVAQRRRFTRQQAIGLLRTQAAVAVIREAPRRDSRAIEEAAAGEIERLRRSDGTFDQTFVRLEIMVRRPS